MVVSLKNRAVAFMLSLLMVCSFCLVNVGQVYATDLGLAYSGYEVLQWVLMELGVSVSLLPENQTVTLPDGQEITKPNLGAELIREVNDSVELWWNQNDFSSLKEGYPGGLGAFKSDFAEFIEWGRDGVIEISANAWEILQGWAYSLHNAISQHNSGFAPAYRTITVEELKSVINPPGYSYSWLDDAFLELAAGDVSVSGRPAAIYRIYDSFSDGHYGRVQYYTVVGEDTGTGVIPNEKLPEGFISLSGRLVGICHDTLSKCLRGYVSDASGYSECSLSPSCFCTEYLDSAGVPEWVHFDNLSGTVSYGDDSYCELLWSNTEGYALPSVIWGDKDLVADIVGIPWEIDDSVPYPVEGDATIAIPADKPIEDVIAGVGAGTIPWTDVVGGYTVPRDDPVEDGKEETGGSGGDEDEEEEKPTVLPVVFPPSLFDSFKDITKKFPFCIPSDLNSMLNGFSSKTGRAPKWTFNIDVPTGYDLKSGKCNYYAWKIVIDMADYDEYVQIFRSGVFILYCVGLIYVTVNIMKWEL